MHAACRKGANGKRGCHIGTGAKLVSCEGCDQKKGSFLEFHLTFLLLLPVYNYVYNLTIRTKNEPQECVAA